VTTIVKAAGPGEFLALVPTMLGFLPRESIVLVPFKSNRTMGAMRVDLPEPGDVKKTASTVLGMVLRVGGIESVAAIVYTERDALYATAFLQAIHREINHSGIGLVDLLYITSEGWGSTADPTAPRPLSELPAAEVTTDVLAPTVLPEVSDEHRQSTVANAHGVEDIGDLVTYLDSILDVTPSELSPSQAKIMHELLRRPALRDIALVQWCYGQDKGGEALDAQLEWEAGAEYPEHLAKHLWGEGPRPVPSRLEQALELTRWVTATIPDAGSYATLAWLSWALGRSTHAEAYAKRGKEHDGEHGLCEIVLSFVNAGHLPGWAFERES
jgi:hypothetical protein